MVGHEALELFAGVLAAPALQLCEGSDGLQGGRAGRKRWWRGKAAVSRRMRPDTDRSRHHPLRRTGLLRQCGDTLWREYYTLDL